MMQSFMTRTFRLGIGIILAALLALTAAPSAVRAAPTAADTAVQPAQEDGEEEGETGAESEEEIPEFEEVVQSIGLVEVVVARVDIPAGTRLREELLETDLRPGDNVAIRAGVTINNLVDAEGRIVKTDIPRGQEILTPMIALSPTDLAGSGSDLALHVDNGRVALAVPVNQLSGAAYAMRPGDFVDALMSFNLIELDVEFQTPLPNIIRQVDPQALTNGQPFLLPPNTQGRLEVIPELENAVAEITPRGLSESGAAVAEQIPRRTSQLTLQQLEVLWVGDWRTPLPNSWSGPNNYFVGEDIRLNEQLPGNLRQDFLLRYGLDVGNTEVLQEVVQNRLQQFAPGVVILSMPLQDALTLKWAYEEPGISLDFVLRAQGDNALFVTTSVSLPQLVEQAGLVVPEPSQFGLQPYIGTSVIPRLPPFAVYDSSLILENGQPPSLNPNPEGGN